MGDLDGICHIQFMERETWCGRKEVREFMFVDLTHAALSVKQGSRLRPCKHCLHATIKRVKEMLSEE